MTREAKTEPQRRLLACVSPRSSRLVDENQAARPERSTRGNLRRLERRVEELGREGKAENGCAASARKALEIQSKRAGALVERISREPSRTFHGPRCRSGLRYGR